MAFLSKLFCLSGALEMLENAFDLSPWILFISLCLGRSRRSVYGSDSPDWPSAVGPAPVPNYSDVFFGFTAFSFCSFFFDTAY